MEFQPGAGPAPLGSAAIRRWALVTVELVITSAALYVLFRGVDLPATARAFRHANYWYLTPAVIFILLDLQFRAVRWRLLLSPASGLRHRNLFGATNVGYLVNDILPFRAGEVARVFMIDELEKTGKVRSAASIAIERGLDLVAMVALVIALFPFVDEPSWTHGPAMLVGGGVLGAFILAMVVSRVNDTKHAFWKAWLKRIPRIGARLDETVNTLLTALLPLRRMTLFATVTALTIIIWACSTLSFLMVMKAFRLDLGISGAALVMGATTLGMVVPSSPGYVGVFHAIAVKTLMEVFGVPRESALTYAVAQHAVIYFVPATLGAAFLWRHRSMWHGVAESVGLRARSPGPMGAQLVGERVSSRVSRD